MWWAITSLGYFDEGLLNYSTILHCTLGVVLKCKLCCEEAKYCKLHGLLDMFDTRPDRPDSRK